MLLESLVDGLVRLADVLFITFQASDHVDHIVGLAGGSGIEVHFEVVRG